MSDNASASEVYAKLLLPKGHGYPLWVPEPDDQLPWEYRRNGVTVGDLGIVTFDGGFDFLFNVCLLADHPINANRVPEAFEALCLEDKDISRRTSMHTPKSCIASAKIKMTRLSVEGKTTENPVVPAGMGGGFRIACSTSEGAILVLPNGSSREDILNRTMFRQYALKHASSWYQHANSRLGREAANGSLYLVTGCDKASAWGVASFANASDECDFSLGFTVVSAGEGNISYACSWQTLNSVDSRTGPTHIDNPPLNNQCVFIRGFKTTLRDSLWAKLMGQHVEASLIQKAKPRDLLDRSNWAPFSNKGGHPWYSHFFDGRGDMGEQGNAPHNDDVLVTHTPEIQMAYHPSNIINKFLLEKFPEAQVAVTHDDIWCSLIDKDSDANFPEEWWLREQFQREYEVAETQDGVFPCRKVATAAALSVDNPLYKPRSVRQQSSKDKRADAKSLMLKAEELVGTRFDSIWDDRDNVSHPSSMRFWHDVEQLVEQLLEIGTADADAMTVKSCSIVLHLAAGVGNEKWVELLLKTWHIDINAKDKYDRTPLSWAAAQGRDKVVGQLIKDERLKADVKDSSKRTPLFWAAGSGNEKVVGLLLRTRKVDVNARDINQRTPLTCASAKGHEKVVELLLKTGAVEIDAKDDTQRTPLSWAAEKGHEKVAEQLIETGKADINAKDRYQRTPLSWAAEKGRDKVVKLLLRTGKIDINAQDQHQRAPLFWAAEKGKDIVVQLLIGGMAEVSVQDENHRTPLLVAVEKGREKVVELLLGTGKVDVNAEDQYQRTPLSLAAEAGTERVVELLLGTGMVDVNAKDCNQRTPLSWAAEKGNKRIVELLIRTGQAEVDAEDQHQRTPLCFAARNGKARVVELLLGSGKVDVNARDDKQRTPLSWAAEKGHEKVVELLLRSARADVNAMDDSQRTPLLLAVASGRDQVVQVLLGIERVDVNARDSRGNTPITLAAMEGHLDIVELLLRSSNINLDARDNQGRTALSLAAEHRHTNIVKLLVDTEKVDINATDSGGRTPLSWAAKEGHKYVVGILLRKGADVYAKDADGNTPLSLADANGNEDVVKLFKAATI